MRDGVRLTAEESKAVRALENLQKYWPASLWLFAGDGALYVMRKDESGERCVNDDASVDQAGIILELPGIEADGGGW